MEKYPHISVVAPAFNEALFIEPLIEKWVSVINEYEPFLRYEIVICNDASTDNTLEILEKIRAINQNLVIVNNSINSGAGTSLYRAIQKSTGKYVLLIDSDDQFDMSDILSQISEIESNSYDAIVGVRSKKDKFLRKIGSKISSMILKKLISKEHIDFNCALKLIDGKVARSLKLRGRGLNYSAEVLIRLILKNCRIKSVRVTHSPRIHGKSSAKLIRDGVARILFIIFIVFEVKLINLGVLNTSEECE
jgi:glycosyltransferase involved in cell wall biosynthesis